MFRLSMSLFEGFVASSLSELPLGVALGKVVHKVFCSFLRVFWSLLRMLVNFDFWGGGLQ